MYDVVYARYGSDHNCTICDCDHWISVLVYMACGVQWKIERRTCARYLLVRIVLTVEERFHHHHDSARMIFKHAHWKYTLLNFYT